MMLRVPDVLSAPAVARVRSLIESADWSDGRNAAGAQAMATRNNRQLPEDGKAARALVLEGLSQNALLFTAALPKKIFPPLFNRYDGRSNEFSNHVDSAVRTWTPTGTHVRTEIAATLFLSDPREYDGGELVVEDSFGPQAAKLRAGELLLYPASSVHRVHRVDPVTRGTRLASFFWVESMVGNDEQRGLLYELDMAIYNLRNRHGENAELIRLTGCYHHLMRMWASA